MLEAWQGYITMEIETGHTSEARSIYKRCYSKRFPGTGSEVNTFWLFLPYNNLLHHFSCFQLGACLTVYGWGVAVGIWLNQLKFINL